MATRHLCNCFRQIAKNSFYRTLIIFVVLFFYFELLSYFVLLRNFVPLIEGINLYVIGASTFVLNRYPKGLLRKQELENSGSQKSIFSANKTGLNSKDSSAYICPDPTRCVRLLIRPTLHCSSRYKLVIVVKSSALDYDLRGAIRATWGAEASALGVPVIFALGRPTVDYSEKHQDRIVAESLANGDLLLVDFDEHYRNLTLKVLGIFQWEHQYCRGPQFFFHTDDDGVVFVKNLMDVVKELSSTKEAVLFGKCNLERAKLIRNLNDKNGVSWDAYPEETIPPMCAGCGYLFTKDVPGKLIAQVPNLSWLMSLGNVEDVVFTGLLAEKAKLKHIPTDHIHNMGGDPLEKCDRKTLVIHWIKTVEEIKSIWQKSKHYRDC